ncbi:MAG TPA: cyclic nucleotide-binding domain-containing protein [Kofleriaceae bacterium]|nr:cyclic nucleotide-binding domain-containing protein [Kofleriaceae bacterium]
MNRRAFALGVALVMAGSFAAVALRSYAEATFLAAYGRANLPWLLIATATGFAAATLGYDALTARAAPRLVDLTLLALLAVLAGGAPALLRAGISPVALVVALTAASQVAGLALWNRVAASVGGRDARRMLPRAGAAVTAGGAIAGLGAAPIIPRLGIDVLPYASAGVAVIVIAIAILQERALAMHAPGAPQAAMAAPQPLGTLQRRLLATLIVAAVLEGVVSTAIDLQFVANVKARYTGDAVAVVLALFYGGTNAVLLVLQLAAIPRLLVTRSLPFTAAIHPLLVIGSYAGFAASPSFVTIAGTRTADQVFRLATSRTSQELALSALPPAPRARWKVLLRGLVWPAGAALAAAVLLALGPHAPPVDIALAAIAFAVAWGIVARVAARRFQAALGAPLGIRGARAADAHRIDLDTLERWTHASGSDDAKLAALARAALARARVEPSDLADHLRHDDPAMRAAMFDQLARSPAPSLRGELRAALAIEDDDRALALGIRALAIAGDDEALARAKARIGLSREVDDAAANAAAMLRGDGLDAALDRLLASDPEWASALVRARRGELGEGDGEHDNRLAARLVRAVHDPATRAGGLVAIVRAAEPRAFTALAAALAAGDPAATGALAEIDDDAAERWAEHVRESRAAMSGSGWLGVARALAGAPRAGALVAELIGDPDPEVAHAALRSALAIARGGGTIPADAVAAASDTALAALTACLDARDASGAWSECACGELAIATRRCVARVLWAAAVAATASGRDPAPIAATARHLVSGADADRKRALDVAQELEMRAPILAALERWLAAGPPSETGDATALAEHDPWLASLARGELAALEPTLLALRRAPLFGSLAGPALAELAERATPRAIDGVLFASGDDGDAMFVVTDGALLARRAGAEPRRIAAGSVVGELAVLTHAKRAADVIADPHARVLAIDRGAFMVASRRAPELVLGLAATLASWLASDRPDVL